MKNQRKAWLAAGLLALVAAACFSDPTSDLQSGPALIVTTFTSVSVTAGDSVAIKGIVRDAQGNALPVGTVSWTSADPNVAVVNLDVVAPVPGDIFTRAYVRGINNQAGVTTVTVTAQGVSATVRVTVLPKTFPGTWVITGTVGPDTVIQNRPAPQTALVIPYTAGDTLVLTATATVTFDPATASVDFGAFPANIISRSASVLKVMARQPYGGKVTVNNLIYAGDATTGPIAIAHLDTDSALIAKARFRGTLAVVGDTLTLTPGPNTSFSAAAGDTTTVSVSGTQAMIFSRTTTTIRAIMPILRVPLYTGSVVVNNMNITAPAVKQDSMISTAAITINRASLVAVVAGDTVTINAPTPATFNTTAGTTQSVVLFGAADSGAVFVRTATQIRTLSLKNFTGRVQVRNVLLGTGRIDSLGTVPSLTVAGASFPYSISQTGNNMLDTVTIVATTAGAKFTIAGTVSQIRFSSGDPKYANQNALVLRRTADTMKVVSSYGSNGKLTVTNTASGAVTIPALLSPPIVTLSSTVTGETTEPANNNVGGAVFTLGTTAAPSIIFGAVNTITDPDDYWTFTLAAAATVTIRCDFGTAAAAADRPDIDILVRNAANTAYVGGFGAATGANPENLVITNLAAGTYHIDVNGYETHSITVAYKLTVSQP